MSAVWSLPEDATVESARSVLAGAGWRDVGAGDWSWVLADPDDERVARITPFDPAYRMFAEDCLHGPANCWLPRVEEIVPLGDNGYIVVMERLWPADERAASALCAKLGIRNDSGYDQPVADTLPDDRELAALRGRIDAMLALGAARYRLWGGSDIRPGNVMATRDGDLKVIDPIFIAGKRIVEALRSGDVNALCDFTRSELEAFLAIPALLRGPESERAALHAGIAGSAERGVG